MCLKAKKIIESLLPLVAKKSGAAIVCGHCGIIFPPHDKDCPVRLAENLLYLEEDNICQMCEEEVDPKELFPFYWRSRCFTQVCNKCVEENSHGLYKRPEHEN